MHCYILCTAPAAWSSVGTLLLFSRKRVEETTLPPRVSYWPGATSHQPFFPTTLLAKKAIHLLPVSTNTCDYYCAFSSNTREEIEAIGWLTNFDEQNLY